MEHSHSKDVNIKESIIYEISENKGSGDHSVNRASSITYKKEDVIGDDLKNGKSMNDSKDVSKEKPASIPPSFKGAFGEVQFFFLVLFHVYYN